MGGLSFERPEAHCDPNAFRAPIVKPHGEHVIIPLVVKDNIEIGTLGTINNLTQILIDFLFSSHRVSISLFL